MAKPFLKLAALAVAAGIALLLAWKNLPPATFHKVTHYGSMGMMGFAIISMIRKFHKERPFSKLSQYIAIIAPIVSFSFYLTLHNKQLHAYFLGMIPAAIAGFVYGRGWRKETKLYWKNGRVYGQNSGMWIVYWGASLMFTQTMAYLKRTHGFSIGLVVTALTSARAVSTAAGLLKGINEVLADPDRQQATPAASTGGPTSCPRCQATVEFGAAFCENCGAATAAPSPPAVPPSPGAFCEQCGKPVAADDAFCEGCGARIEGDAA